jgi:hypothetical protein
LSHHLGVCQTRLSLETAFERSRLVTLVDWIAERAYKDQPLGTVSDEGRKVHVIPDGGFVLSVRHAGQLHYLQCVLEYDTGSENAKAALREKVRHYLLLCQQPEHHALIILFVVPSQARLLTLATAAVEEAKRLGVDPARFWFTTSAQLGQGDDAAVDAPIWHSTASCTPFSLTGFVRQALPDHPAVATVALEPAMPMDSLEPTAHT